MKDLLTLQAELESLATLCMWASDGMTQEASELRASADQVYNAFFAVQSYLERIAEDVEEVGSRLFLNNIEIQKLPSAPTRIA